MSSEERKWDRIGAACHSGAPVGQSFLSGVAGETPVHCASVTLLGRSRLVRCPAFVRSPRSGAGDEPARAPRDSVGGVTCPRRRIRPAWALRMSVRALGLVGRAKRLGRRCETRRGRSRAIVSTTSLRTAGSAGCASSASTSRLRPARACPCSPRLIARRSRGLPGARRSVGENQRRAAFGARHGAAQSRSRRRARGRRCARGSIPSGASRTGSRPHNRRAWFLRGRDRCRRSRDNRRRSRGAAAAEMVKLRTPYRFVRPDAVEEDDRRRLSAAGLA